MNGKQIAVLIIAIVVLAFILWHDIPIESPGLIVKTLMLFVKLFIVVAVAIFVYIFSADKKKSS